ncbi:hypothetical protein [Aminobacter sp. AP02]|uniref:hypothetical protein n=1 Tax=Aminobacter sp. AP02 TaxID=2135737 RepID=UPI000D6ABC57|nr:hypothetical protein [Aminobacter sp. AP02]PWK69100.1 hypothetical protein C8K44_109130 [Aminobacter sp. AP02]
MSIIGEFHQFGAVLRHACRDSRVEKMMNGLPRELQVELGWFDRPASPGSGSTSAQLHKYGRVAMLINKLPLDIQIELGWPVGPLAPATNVIEFSRQKARCA